MSDKAFITCLWFDTEAEEAAAFYTGIVKDSKLGRVHRHTEAGPGPAGSVMLVEFELNGQKFFALNGGPENYGFSEAVSIMVECENQAEVDYYWDRLTEGGAGVACGWLEDKYGFRWRQEEEAPRTDWESWPLVAWTSQTTVRVPAVQSPWVG